LLALEDRAWTELMQAVSLVPADRREVEGVVPGWSTHDLVWHAAYWAGHTANAIELIRLGLPEPEESEDEEAFEAENAAVVDAGRAMTWAEAMGHLEKNRVRARMALEAFDRVVPESAFEPFSEETIEHYSEHARQVRAWAETEG